jgi:hypothetical protein
MPISYHDPNNRFTYTDDTPTQNFQDEADDNTIKIAGITIIFFAIYSALLIAGATETNTATKNLYELILNIFNLGVIGYAFAIGYYVVKTLFSWFKQAVQRMR